MNAGSGLPSSALDGRESGSGNEPTRATTAGLGSGGRAGGGEGGADKSGASSSSASRPGGEPGSDSDLDAGNELVIILCTFPKVEDIGEIAFTLIGANLCACVNVLHESLSIYRWRGEIVTNREVLCLLKTSRSRHAELVARLSELHPYDVPEIVTLPTCAVNEPYLRWVQEETDPHRSSTGPISIVEVQKQADAESED